MDSDLDSGPLGTKVVPGLIPVKRIMSRPRAILNVEHLMSRKGVAALPKIFAETRFKGKGHELEDLRLLLSKSKHWAHRLFPLLTFEDFVEKTEQLGSKKQLKNFMMKIRHDIPLNLDPQDEVVHSDGDSDREIDLPDLEPGPVSSAKESELQFDRLFKDHIDDMMTAKDGDDKDDDGNIQQSTQPTTPSSIPKPKHQQPSVEDFAMDDDDFDEDFLESFKPWK